MFLEIERFVEATAPVLQFLLELASCRLPFVDRKQKQAQVVRAMNVELESIVLRIEILDLRSVRTQKSPQLGQVLGCCCASSSVLDRHFDSGGAIGTGGVADEPRILVVQMSQESLAAIFLAPAES